MCLCLLGHVFAGLPPGQASDRARVGQVDEGEVNQRGFLIRGVLDHHSRTPARGGVPHLQQAVILHTHTHTKPLTTHSIFTFEAFSCSYPERRTTSRVE